MASKQKTDQTVRMATPEMLKQIWAIVMQALPTRLTFTQAKYWIEHGTELARKIRAIFTVVDPYREHIATWERFYRDALGLSVDLSALRIPDKKEGFDWLIVVVPGVTIERVLSVCAKYFKVWRWTNDNLDQLTESVRSAPTDPYAVWVRPRIEADEEHKNKSYNDLQKDGISGITLLEYLLLHLQHFIATGQHLDEKSITLCSSSLYRYGSVAYAGWGPGSGELYVNWYSRDGAYVGLRVREVVPVP